MKWTAGKVVETVVEAMISAGAAYAAGKGVRAAFRRFGAHQEDEDILDSGYEPNIGDGVDDDLKEDPPED